MAITARWLQLVNQNLMACDQAGNAAFPALQALRARPDSATPAQLVQAIDNLSNQLGLLRIALGNLLHAHDDELRGAGR